VLVTSAVPHHLITPETVGRLDRHRVTTHLLLAAMAQRAEAIGDEELIALTRQLSAIDREHGHLLEAVLEALTDDG
jgi:hypothetical protein